MLKLHHLYFIKARPKSMIESATLLTYIAIVLGFVFIPGPAALMIMARSVSSGSKVGEATGAGIALGDLMHTLFSVVGISAIIAASVTLFTLIKYLGAVYLVYLGVRAILEKSATKLSQHTSFITAKKAFKQGVIVEVLNPKTALFFLAFLPQFVDGVKPSVNYMINYGKNDKPYYHLLFTINADNLVKIEALSEKQFKQNGGQFEVLLRKDEFAVEAQNSQSDIILRMPWVASQFELSQKYLLYKKITALAHSQKGSVTVAIELTPYVKVEENKLLLTHCNVYFRHAHHQLS
jgi:threonine/homoserine/homoserine lactone efflux protein